MNPTTIIQTGRKGVERPVVVERSHRRRRIQAEELRRRIAANDAAAASRDLVHEIGVSAVAHALGLAHMLDLGGAITAERGRALDERRSETRRATEPEIRCRSATRGAQETARNIPEIIPATLAADIGRHIHPARGCFGSALWLGVTL